MKPIIPRLRAVLNHRYRYQFLAAITVQMITFAHGVATGWISPTLHKLQSNDSPTNFIVSVEQVSWIGSLLGLGSLTGNILFGVLLNRIGRKWCMYLIAVPFMGAWILIYFSKTYIYLYVARFLSGVTGGGNFVVVPIYISEIADSSIRGALSSMAMFFLSFGIMTGFIVSSYVDYYLSSCIIIIIPIVYLVSVSQFPDTPQFLLRKLKMDAARKAFNFYKNFPSHENIDASTAKQQVKNNAEFEELKTNILCNNEQSQELKFRDFGDRDSLKAFATAFVLLTLNQFSGGFAFFNYMSDIFAQTGTDIDPNTCTIYMGVAQVMGTCFTMILVDRFGRKVLMLVSSGGMAVGLLGFGLYMQYTSAELKLEFNWVPVVCMTCIIILSGIGVGALIHTIIVEIMPTKIRAPATCICMALLSVMVFVALKILPLILQDYGLATLLFFCGGFCVFGWFYLLMCLKETKGKSLDK